jgi:Xaa-Pro aminopeptidase
LNKSTARIIKAQDPEYSDPMSLRIQKIQKNLKNGDSYYIAGSSDIFYLSGFSGTSAKIVIKNDSTYFITDMRYEGMVEKLGINRNFQPVITKNYLKDIKKCLSRSNYVNITRSTPLNDYINLQKSGKRLKFSGLIMDLRMIKSPDEIENIKKAARINEKAISNLVKRIRCGVTESDISAEFEYYVKCNGAEGTSFSSIIAFDENSAIPHSMVSDRKLKTGSLILLDTGVKYGGYCSDLTRVVGFGIIDTRYKEILKNYGIVRKAKEIGVSYYIEGGLIKNAELKVREYLTKHGLEQYFTHSLGHSIGIDVHEPPSVNTKEKKRFKNGMVFTCEPGVYFPGKYGIRIEDDYLITEKGAEKLNGTSDALITA